jgi:hypothetical protein
MTSRSGNKFSVLKDEHKKHVSAEKKKEKREKRRIRQRENVKIAKLQVALEEALRKLTRVDAVTPILKNTLWQLPRQLVTIIANYRDEEFKLFPETMKIVDGAVYKKDGKYYKSQGSKQPEEVKIDQKYVKGYILKDVLCMDLIFPLIEITYDEEQKLLMHMVNLRNDLETIKNS